MIQIYNSSGYYCAEQSGQTDDGFMPGVGANYECAPHMGDYNGGAADWVIDLSELLRLIQFYNSGGYHACDTGEDGFCPGPPAPEEGEA